MDDEALLNRPLTAAELQELVPDPVARIRVISARSKKDLCLPSDLKLLRWSDVHEVVNVRKLHSCSELARLINLSRQRVCDILRDAERECLA